MTDSILHILEAYDLVPPVEPFVLNGRGVNNIARGIHTGAGDFVLKTYQTQDNVAVIEYEHHLLSRIAQDGLPFAVPTPLRARNGTTICGTPSGWHALFTWLAGTPGNAGEATHVVAAGQALGALHQVVTQYPAEPRPGVVSFGDLDHIHPHVPNPLELFSRQHVHRRSSHVPLLRWWRTEVHALQAFVEHDYKALPTQIIHGDFVLGNLLFQAENLTAVLDWEFAVLDVRAMDVATLLISILFANRVADLRSSTKLAGQSYRNFIQLTAEEIEALPWLIRLWNAVNLIWRVGQDFAADQKRPVQIDRLMRVQRTAHWLEHHADDVTNAFSA